MNVSTITTHLVFSHKKLPLSRRGVTGYLKRSSEDLPNGIPCIS